MPVVFVSSCLLLLYSRASHLKAEKGVRLTNWRELVNWVPVLLLLFACKSNGSPNCFDEREWMNESMDEDLICFAIQTKEGILNDGRRRGSNYTHHKSGPNDNTICMLNTKSHIWLSVTSTQLQQRWEDQMRCNQSASIYFCCCFCCICCDCEYLDI